MIKPLKVSDKSVRRFITHKKWNYNNISGINNILLEQEGQSGAIDLFLNESSKLSVEQSDVSNLVKISKGKNYDSNEPFYPTGHRLHDPNKELLNIDGTYQRSVYKSIKHLFYNEYGVTVSNDSITKNPLMVFGTETGNFMQENNESVNFLMDNEDLKLERRIIGDEIIVIQFDSKNFGEKIKPGDFKIVDYSSPYGVIEIVDDGATNLVIDSTSFNDIKETSNQQLEEVSQSRNTFDFNNLSFGYKLASNGIYFLTGQPVSDTAPTEINSGKASLFKLNTETDAYETIREFYNPFTQNGFSLEIYNDNTGFVKNELGGLLVNGDYSINDNFGDAVEFDGSFCVIGSSRSHIRGVCSDTATTGHLFIYGRNKGGNENWGLLNIIEGEPNTEFGASVSIHGDTMAVGAPNHNEGEGAIYIFKRESRTTSHFWKRISDVYDDYEYDEKTKRYTGLPKGELLEKNNKWVSRYKIQSMIPEEDTLNFFYQKEDNELWVCTEPSFTSYSVSRHKGIYDQLNGVFSSYWVQGGVVSVSKSDTSESSIPYPVDVYDSTDTLLGHITFTGKPKTNRIYYKPVGSYYDCYVGEIENNVCRFKSEIVLSGYDKEDCVDIFSYTRYEVGKNKKITDSELGIISSFWSHSGIVSMPSVNKDDDILPRSIDIYLNDNFIAHVTISGQLNDNKIYFKSNGGICYEGDVIGEICKLYKQIKLEGKLISDKFNDYQVTSEHKISDQENGVTSSTWIVDGILSIPSTNSEITKQPYAVDVYYENTIQGHITFTGVPVSNSIYFTMLNGNRLVGTIVDNRCDLHIIDLKETPLSKVPVDKCSDENPNNYYISAWQWIHDEDNGIIVTSWTYEGIISLPSVDVEYGSRATVVDIYDESLLLVGHVLFMGDPIEEKIYFKDRNDICYSGYIYKNKCILSSLEVEKPTEEDWCEIDAHEINTFEGDTVSMVDNMEGYPLHRYEEDEDGNYSPKYSVGDDTWEFSEMIKIPNSSRLGENLKLTKSFLYSTSPGTQMQLTSIFKREETMGECMSFFKHTHDINKYGIFKYKESELYKGDGFDEIEFAQTHETVHLKVKLNDSLNDVIEGFVYRVNRPLNQKIIETDFILSGGEYINGEDATIDLKNGEFEIYLGRVDKNNQLIGEQSRIFLIQNPILNEETERSESTTYKYEYNIVDDGRFGESIDASENYLIIGDSCDREYSSKGQTFKNGAVYVFNIDNKDFSFFDKLYTSTTDENNYSSKYGISVSLQSNNFVVGEPLVEQSEISVMDDGETFSSENYGYGVDSHSDTSYTQIRFINTDSTFKLVGNDYPDVEIHISRTGLNFDENMIEDFMVYNEMIDVNKNYSDYVKIPNNYIKYKISSDDRIADYENGIISSKWEFSGNIYLPQSDSELSSEPTSIDVYKESNFIGHITYTGSPKSKKIIIYDPTELKFHEGTINDNICNVNSMSKSFGVVTRGVYRNLTKLTDTHIILYADLLSSALLNNNTTHIDNTEFLYYENKVAAEGKVHYYAIGEDSISKVKEIVVNKQKKNIRHQFGSSVSLSQNYLYVGSPVLGDFNINKIESFEGYDLGLFGQCSSLYNSYGSIIWGRQSRYQNRNIFGKVITYDMSTHKEGKKLYIGNIFYKNGIAVITNESEYFKKLFTGSSNTGFSFDFKGSHTIYENEILCTINPNEFNVSTNPTSVMYGSIDYDVNVDLKFDILDLSYIYRFIEGTLNEDTQNLDYDEYTVRKESLETISRHYSLSYPTEIDIFNSKVENVGKFSNVIPVEKSFGFLEIRKYNSGTQGNPFRYNDVISVGDVVMLPNDILYEVSSVQTIESISKMTGASVDSILEKNNLKDGSMLYVGQVLKIPNGGEVKNTMKLEDGQNTQWPNDDIILTESEDALIVDMIRSVLDEKVSTSELNEIIERLKALHDSGLLDIDGDGEVTMVDAMLLVRYFVGRTGVNLTKNLVNSFSPNATRTKPFDIIQFLDERTGKQRGVKILQDFVDYKENDLQDQTGSYLAPYVTTIGLYSGLELVMTAKLSKPVKIVPNYPINFLVKYDT